LSWRIVRTTQRIAVLEAELSTMKMDAVQLAAQIRGHEVQIASLSASVDHKNELTPLPRTEAILTALRAAEGTLAPSEILARLLAAGRTDDLRKVTATLDYLVKGELVKRPSRGRYLAV
jgi:hypothetical protein